MLEKVKSDCDHSCIISYLSEPGMGSIPEGKKNFYTKKWRTEWQVSIVILTFLWSRVEVDNFELN